MDSSRFHPEMICNAWLFAGLAHKSQKYHTASGTISYLAHLGMVASMARSAAIENGAADPETAELVGILHDCMEDCSVTFDALLTTFGRTIANDVQALSKRKDLHGLTACMDSIDRITGSLASSAAGMVKLADRLANLSGLPHPKWADEKVAEYIEESKYICKRLRDYSEFLAVRLEGRIAAWERTLEN
jgi:(p)ppGpp synthase/HD superfamily hydrolase